MKQTLNNPGRDAIRQHGWLKAHKWLLLRRFSQLVIPALFIISPWLFEKFGVWLIKGNLASSLTLDMLPLSDPYVLLQSVLAGHWPLSTALIGGAFVVAIYLVLGGRAYCGWVCPINPVTDLAAWLRRKLGIKGGVPIGRNTRYWILGFTLLLALVSGTLAWELINPVSIVFRGLVFGLGMGWGVLLAIFLLDLFVSRHAWCGHLCPVGAFYSLLGSTARAVSVSAVNRNNCDDCMDCFVVCPESQILRLPLKGADKGSSPVIGSGHCLNCGRCIDVCTKDVFEFQIIPFRSPSNDRNNTLNDEAVS